MTQIPVVDLEVALSDNPPRELLDEIRFAAEQIGSSRSSGTAWTQP